MLLIVMALSAAIVPAGTSFRCTPTAVYDGDGPIWCAEGPHVRLVGIAAREMDGSCRSNQPCPDATAIEARDALVRLLGGARGRLSTGHIIVAGPAMACISRGSAGGTRTAAQCSAPFIGDLSCAMVRSGTAMRWSRYGGDRLCGRRSVKDGNAEGLKRASRIGGSAALKSYHGVDSVATARHQPTTR